MGRNWKSFEVHARNCLCCHEPTIKEYSGGSSERKETFKESLSLLREYLNNPETDVGRNMKGKCRSDEISDAHKGRYWKPEDRPFLLQRGNEFS